MKISNRNQAMLRAVVGGYVIYLAYEIIQNGLAGESSMPMWLCILCAVFLGGAGIAILILSWKTYRAKDQEEEKAPDDPNSLK